MKKSTIWLLAVNIALTFYRLLYVQIMYIEYDKNEKQAIYRKP